jgi:hypothetical protein
MSKTAFDLRLVDWEEVHALPDSWPLPALRQVLSLADFDDDVGDEDAADMAAMSLQDLGERKASELVLEVVFGAAMSPGVRQNLWDDLQDDRPWEQFARVDQQAGLFEAIVLLHRAFPRSFGFPDALRLRVELAPTDSDARARLRTPPSPAFMLRLLAGGMDPAAVLKRLYEADLAGDRFPDAPGILWRIDPVPPADPSEAARAFDIYSSWQWLGPLEDREPWRASGWADGSR